MARQPRIKVPGHAAGYHVVTRVHGRQGLLDKEMREFFFKTLRGLQSVFRVKVGAVTVMPNHYHLLVTFDDPEDVDEKEAVRQWNAYHEEEYHYNEKLDTHRKYVVRTLTDISSFMKKLNVLITRHYNRLTGGSGTLWERRFRSTVIERGWSMVNCAAYIELNSFRASLSRKPEDYRYSSINLLQRGNPGNLIDLSLLEEGLCISGDYEHAGDRQAFEHELFRTYLAFIYESGTTAHRDRNGMPDEQGIVVTPEMQERLARYAIETEQGSFSARVREYIQGKFAGGADFARRYYLSHINPGLTGKALQRHMKRWIAGISNGVFGVCSGAAAPGAHAKKSSRQSGSPSRGPGRSP